MPSRLLTLTSPSPRFLNHAKQNDDCQLSELRVLSQGVLPQRVHFVKNLTHVQNSPENHLGRAVEFYVESAPAPAPAPAPAKLRVKFSDSEIVRFTTISVWKDKSIDECFVKNSDLKFTPPPR